MAYTYQNYYKPQVSFTDDLWHHPDTGIDTLLKKNNTYSSIDQLVNNYAKQFSSQTRNVMNGFGWDTSEDSFFGKGLNYLDNYGLTDALIDVVGTAYPLTNLSLAKFVGLTPASSKAWTSKAEAREAYLDSANRLADWATDGGGLTYNQFKEYIRDATNLGLVDTDTSRDALKAYNKLKDNNFNYKKLSKEEAKALTRLTDSLYMNDANFKYIKDTEFMKLSDKDKIDFLGSTIGSFGVPAPTYLDTGFDNYQKEVEPLKFYTNKELADIYNIDYDFENIKKDLDNAAEAKVALRDWEQALIANNAERDNTSNITSYLDAIRNIKSEAIQKGISNGARAAAEVVANQQAIADKVQTNHDAAIQRMSTVDDAIQQRARTQVDTLTRYDDLAQHLSNAGVSLYGNDVARKGEDMLANANFLSADENLRSNREAQNNLMRAIYNSVGAQSNIARQQAYEQLNYFKDIVLPANDYNYRNALSSYINAANLQNYGYIDTPTYKGQEY